MSEDGDLPPTPWRIRFYVILTFVIFLLAAFVIYYRFMTTPPTNCNIFVQGNKDMDGTTIVVERVIREEDIGGRTRLTDRMTDETYYSARFFLPSGTYQITMVDKNGNVSNIGREFIPPGTRITYDLTRRATSRPART